MFLVIVFGEEIVINKLRKINKNAIIVFTRGELGAKIIHKEQIFSEKAKKVRLASTVGAGDNFTAGMIYSLSQISRRKRQLEIFTDSELQNMLHMGISFSADVCKSVDNYISNEFANSL